MYYEEIWGATQKIRISTNKKKNVYTLVHTFTVILKVVTLYLFSDSNGLTMIGNRAGNRLKLGRL